MKTNLIKTALYSSCACASLILSGCASEERIEAYHAPLTSVGARFGALPAAVQNTVRAQTGAAQISDIEKEHQSIGTVYKISYADEGLYPPLFVAVDGSVINPDMTVAVGATHDETTIAKGGAAGGMHFSDLPEPVAHVVENAAPQSDILSIDKQLWGNRVVYIIGFHDEMRHPRLYVESDGTILRQAHQ
jgi:hypothetical protein